MYSSPRLPGFIGPLAEFLRPAIFSRRSKNPVQLRSTAYLDGLRGVAAFLVYLAHHQSWAHPDGLPIMEMGYGYDGQKAFCSLPIVRIFFLGGHFAVSIFFVISGYVLSRGPLQKIQDRRYAELSQTLASAMFRRPFRLFIPVIGTTFCFLTIWHLGPVWTAYPEHKETYFKELRNWVWEFSKYSYVYRDSGIAWLTYNLHSWSIPTEYKGSMVVYTTLLAVSRASAEARLLIYGGLIFYFIYIVDGWFASLFLIGVLLADTELLLRSKSLPDWSLFRFLQKHSDTALAISLFLGLWLGSQPGGPGFNASIEYLEKSPGWYYLSKFIPAACTEIRWFWYMWGALFTVCSVTYIPWLRRVFETRPAQYLGRISFSLYLVHGPVLWTIADRLYTAVGRTREGQNEGILAWKDIYPLPSWGPLGLEFNFLICHVLILPITLYLSELATKAFDEPSVQFAHWLYRKVT